MANHLRRTAVQMLKKQKLAPTSSFRLSSTDSEKNILTSVYRDLPVTNYTINDFVWLNLDRWPDKTATVCAVTGRGYTYAQTHKMSVTFAASLRTKLKLQDGDTVAVVLPNIPEYPCTLLGILQAGCIAGMMNPVYTPDELQRQLELISCKAIVATKISYANIKTALNTMKKNIPVILVEHEGLPEGTIKFAELAEDLNVDVSCLKSVHRKPDDVAVLPFSSGTTGFPKGVVLTHRSVVAANFAIADPEIVAIKETTATYQSVIPAILPFFHIFGFNAVMLNQMHMGVKLVTMPYFKPDFFIQTIAGHKAHVLFIVPPMAIFLGKHPAVTTEHLKSIHSIICGAAPLSETDIATVLKKNNNIVFRQGYGLTETNAVVAIGRNTDSVHASVGHVVGSSRVKVVHTDTLEPLGLGQEGEIWFKGPNVMQGFYKNDAATAEVMHDGWFRTGDIGKYDENKYLYVTDRLKELIKVKGFQVPPAELETVIRTHPKIIDCAVLGIPDPINGEAPKAFIVPQPGQKIDTKEILEYVNSKVAVFKKLKEVQIVEDIPKNAAGKILRKDLKAKYC